MTAGAVLFVLAWASPASAETWRAGAERVPAVEVVPADAGGPAPPPSPQPSLTLDPVSPAAAEVVLDEAEAALAGAGEDREVTLALQEVGQILPALSGPQRARARRMLARPTEGPSVEGASGYTVPARSLASAHFCVFWVERSADAIDLTDADGDGLPDLAEATAAFAEFSWKAEHGRLGWRVAARDGKRGCRTGDGRSRSDIYLQDLDGVYGYAVPDRSGYRGPGYQLIDNDMAEVDYAAYPLEAIAVTVAHEYNHVVQFGYTYDADSWMSESTATALEELVFPDINDYVNYVSALASRVEVPFTTNDDSGKVYAGSTFNLFLARRHGPRTLPAMWAQSLRTTPLDFGLEAYNRGIQRRTAGRSSFLREFVHYAASLPEWQTSGVYADGASFWEVERSATLRRGNPSLLALHHTTYRLLDVVQRSGSRVRLLGRAPRGIRSGIALVGRRTDGEIETVVRLLPRGGAGSVSLQEPAAYDRITAVLVNAHRGIRGAFDSDIGDWPYTGDRKGYAARLAPEREKESLAG